ncbi:MAG: ATP-binding protein [Desulfatirhabdiaceae bacterium]|nr:ATP-binding protein [Desulfatirhabdiaceae bacterium]
MMPEIHAAFNAIQDGESETVELKSSFDREVIETLVAFANAKGGRVFVGVADSGRITGIDAGKGSAVH